MYSRRTHEGSLKIPEHYSGTAFRNGQITPERDAVGRLSALPEKPREQAKQDHIHIKKKAPLPKPHVQTEEVSEKQEIQETVQENGLDHSFQTIGNDDIIIGALLLSLIDGKRENGEDITLIILLLLLIL